MIYIEKRMNGNSLYILDELESALSVASQMQILVKIKQLVDDKSQFIIATHSPIPLAYPDADVFVITDNDLPPECPHKPRTPHSLLSSSKP